MYYLFSSRIKPFHVFLITLLLTAPALLSGYLGDDYIHHLLLGAEINVPKSNDVSLYGLFSWVDSDPVRNRVLMDLGAIPWWTDETMRYQFWRPLAEISHWIDHKLWRDFVPLMHLQSLLWYVLLGLGLNRLYKLSGVTPFATVIALAAFLFDSTHGFTISWIANRNAIMAAVFGVFCLYHFIEWRNTASNRNLIFSLLLLAASLFSGEIGISTCCYLGAYAFTLDKAGPKKALLALWPFVVLSITWWALYKLGHFGANNSDVNYIDPLESPLIFLSEFFERVPVMLFSQYGIVPAEIYGFSPEPIPVFLIIALAYLALVLAILSPLLCVSKVSRFWLLGSAFAVVPVTSALPADRNLLMVGIGASAVLGMFFEMLKARRLSSTKFVRYGGYLFLSIHLIISPLLMPVLSYSPKIWNKLMGLESTLNLPIESQHDRVLMFGVPMPVALATTPMRYANNLVLPNNLWLISSDQSPFMIERTDVHQIRIESEKGMISTIEQALRNIDKNPMPLGYEVALDGVTIGVSELDKDNHPTQLTLVFSPDAIGDVVIVTPTEEGFMRSALPEVGESLTLFANKGE